MILRFTLILLLTLLATSSFAQNNLPARTPARSERQKAAEEAADRVMHRFYETLDFGAIYKEMYVADPLKTAEVRWTIRGILMQGVFALPSQERPKTLNIDFAAMGRAYIAKENFDFLSSAVKFTYDGDESKLKKEFEQKYHEFYEPMASEGIRPILTSERLDSVMTANLNHLNDFFRKYIVTKNFGTPRYKAECSLVQESRAEESERMKDLFGLNRHANVFVVRRENHYLYFIEENGDLRMLSSTPRIMD